MNAAEVLDFWFDGDPTAFRRERWFKRDDVLDAQIRERFAFTVEAAIDGALDAWSATPEGALALVIVLDQFPRNIHRGSYLAFGGDAHARRIARNAVAEGLDVVLTPVQRCFLYLPFEHSEDLADQDLAVLLFDALKGEPELAGAVESAQGHREVIRRFGRFPHRNAAVGRSSTPEELAYIASSGGNY